MNTLAPLPASWMHLLSEEFQKEYYKNIKQKIVDDLNA